jgi:hypothetical protein
MKDLISSSLVAVAALLGCTERGPTPTPDGIAAAPVTGAAANEPGRVVPPPTRNTSTSDMRYFYWEPGVPVTEFGADERSRAEAVLASDTVRALIGAAAGDGFVFEKSDEKKGMVTFRQTRDFRGQAVIVDGAYATVELTGDTSLVYLGTGFRAGLTPPDRDLEVDEAQAEKIATAAYAAAEGFAGKATTHLDPGLRVHRLSTGATHLAYAIHVERAAGEGHPRPTMFIVDAQSGMVIDQHQAWMH